MLWATLQTPYGVSAQRLCSWGHPHYTATTAFCCCYYYYYVTIIAIALSLYPFQPHGFSALIWQHRPFAVLRQAGFPYHAFPQLYAVGRDQAGAAKQCSPKRIILNWLSKGGEAGSQVLFPHIPPVMAHFFNVFISPFSSLFFYLPKFKPNFHSATPYHFFFFHSFAACSL